MIPEVRRMDPGEEAVIASIEAAADRRLEPFGYWPLPSTPAGPPPVITLVAGRPAVGFAEVALVDGEPHLAQISVLPDHGGKGVGRALVHAVCQWAGSEGHDVITLTTFADIPFNAPWYARLGFVEFDAPRRPDLERIVAQERPLERLGRRVTMRRLVWEDRSDER